MSKKSTNEKVILVMDKKMANQPTKKKRNRKQKNVVNSNIQQISRIRTVPITSTRQTSSSRIDRKFCTGPRKEFITSLMGSTGNFEIKNNIILNAGNPNLSIWLARLASLYESYRFKYLRIHYIQRCSSTTSGFVAICPDSNPHDPPPEDEFQAFQNEKTKSSAPWDTFSVDLTREMLNKRKTYFCRKNGNIPDGADKDFYDVGNLFLLAGSNAVGTALGQVWIEYDCEFFTPEYSPSADNTVLLSSDNRTTNSTPFGSNSSERIVQQIGEIIDVTSPNILTFKRPFHGIMSVKNTGTSITAAPQITAVSAGSSFNLSEGPFNMTQSFYNPAATAGVMTSLIKMASGGTLNLQGVTSVNPYSTLMSLTPCLL